MTFLAFLTQILDYIGYGETIKAFLVDDMAKLLRELGDIEFATAITSINDMKLSSDPGSELREAITHFKSAYQTFYNAASRWHLVNVSFVNNLTRMQNYRKASECSILISTCYAYLGQERLKQEYIEKANRSFDSYAKIKIKTPDKKEFIDILPELGRRKSDQHFDIVRLNERWPTMPSDVGNIFDSLHHNPEWANIFDSLHHNPEFAWLALIPVALIPVLGTVGYFRGKREHRERREREIRQERRLLEKIGEGLYPGCLIGSSVK